MFILLIRFIEFDWYLFN